LYKTPVNLAVSPDGRRLYVACQHSNSLVVVDPERREPIREVAVGQRPEGVAVSPDGQRVYVTTRLDDTLSALDATTLEVLARVPVGDEPHGVVPNAGGTFLFVLNTEENSISVVDALELRELRRLAAGRGPWAAAMSPNGRSIHVTSVRPNVTRFRQPHHSEVTVLNADPGSVKERLSASDANMLKGVAVVPSGPHAGTVLFTLIRCKELVPATRLAQGWTITNGLGVIRPDKPGLSERRVDQVLLDQPADSFPDPNDVAVRPDGRYALVTSGGSDRVAVVDVKRLVEVIESASDAARETVLPNHLGLSSEYVVKRISVGGNPRGVVFSPDGRFAYVAEALSDTVAVIDASDFSMAGRIDLGGPDAVSELRRGERVFHSAAVTFCRQFSCQSCHPDGHVHGLTIDIEAEGLGLKPVDNRTLRGILDTGPFKWEGTNPTLARQCGARLAVFFTRLAPYTPEHLRALEHYMCTIERPPNRFHAAEGLSPEQYRGKRVFERRRNNHGERIPPEKQCTHCHNGPYKTAQNRSDVGTTMWFDVRVNLPVGPDVLARTREFSELGVFLFRDTGAAAEPLDAPHLNNIYDSAPYLHNGSAATLEEIWTLFNMTEDHGQTRDLTRRQFNELIAYLKSL